MSQLFNKRHYEWLADFARAYLNASQKLELADRLRSTNNGFNRDRFLNAAGYTLNDAFKEGDQR